MSLVSSTALLKDVVARGRTIVAPNVFNGESIAAVIDAAEDINVPVIVSVGETDIEHIGLEQTVAYVKIRSNRSKVPVVLHLDHGSNFDIVVRCIRAGFTSVMIDISLFPTEIGIELVKKIVEIAHAVDVSVESMVGRLKLATDSGAEMKTDEELTDPETAREFVDSTGIDSLAVSVGTEHGSILVGKSPLVDMERLKEISKLVQVPLVVHGGSGISDVQLKALGAHRVGKINIGSAIRLAFRESMRLSLGDDKIDMRDALHQAQKAMYTVVRTKMQALTS